MLGVHFETSTQSVYNEIVNAIKVYAYGVESYHTDANNRLRKINTHGLSCEDEGKGRWDNGEL